MKKIIDFYFTEDKKTPVLASIEIDGQRHFSADIRTWGIVSWTVCISGKTLSDKLFNQQEVDRYVNLGVYTKKTIEVEVEIFPDYITHINFKNPFNI
jgi:hypothetical protein